MSGKNLLLSWRLAHFLSIGGLDPPIQTFNPAVLDGPIKSAHGENG
jgi:hypothetical protein